ncbi:MAG: MarR family winged helix-turn-helix transcriptional regulator [Alphaproteobacteria bacterium]
MKKEYFQCVMLIERLHKLFFDLIKIELDSANVRDINGMQAFILYNIACNQLTVGELSYRGYYLGSNVSYNLRKMIDNGYVLQVPSLHDKRSTHVKLSEKGIRLYERIEKLMEEHSSKFIARFKKDDLITLNNKLRQVESFWSTLLTES